MNSILDPAKQITVNSTCYLIATVVWWRHTIWSGRRRRRRWAPFYGMSLFTHTHWHIRKRSKFHRQTRLYINRGYGIVDTLHLLYCVCLRVNAKRLLVTLMQELHCSGYFLKKFYGDCVMTTVKYTRWGLLCTMLHTRTHTLTQYQYPFTTWAWSMVQLLVKNYLASFNSLSRHAWSRTSFNAELFSAEASTHWICGLLRSK